MVLVGPAVGRSAEVTVSDPRGDVESLEDAGQRQRRSVDLRRVRYAGDDERLVVRVTYVDLRTDVRGTQFLDTRFVQGQEWIVASAEVGSEVVMMFTGPSFYECEGSDVRTEVGADTLRLRIPVACLEGFEESKARTTSWSAKRNGSPLLVDDARRVALSLG